MLQYVWQRHLDIYGSLHNSHLPIMNIVKLPKPKRTSRTGSYIYALHLLVHCACIVYLIDYTLLVTFELQLHSSLYHLDCTADCHAQHPDPPGAGWASQCGGGPDSRSEYGDLHGETGQTGTQTVYALLDTGTSMFGSLMSACQVWLYGGQNDNRKIYMAGWEGNRYMYK